MINIPERVTSAVRSVYDNAPLLRFLNPNSRYNRVPSDLSATNGNAIDGGLTTGTSSLASDPSRVRAVDGHVVYVGETNDGVFSNLSAKPTTAPQATPDTLPSYSEASHDPSPPYWETSVMSEFDEIYIDGIPAGNVFNFLWSALVSVLFQFLGFVITYLLHTSHAAKNGAQLGLGVTILNLGVVSLPVDISKTEIDSAVGRFEPSDPAAIDVSASTVDTSGSLDTYRSSLTGHADFSDVNSSFLLHGKPVLSYTLFLLGGFLILKSIYDFYKVKRLEYSIMFPITGPNVNTETSGNTSPTNATPSNNDPDTSARAIELEDVVAQRV